ncbi:PAAR domain-containing protein [Chromobacterium subtsugae]|uniref:PAAR domain-containing protein n=1 Tax=Chromobacterium subtsugae TaxID=251747 RepID=A0ABS7FCM3_9NEIS|nr:MULTISPECIES: PAAR domain-containing protein [Chromobacterium]MBW7566318.1 PAAR domain-containing protein [Chromobacterium subtsugae]MBW8287823.1 PAAR domain-containing protein [Chromobacterium subtsugae]WSE91152.1 PAAR domain-containing protein [Chromobacterium subtsugae]WVH59527.1 PAAR domain-containing protein [Chromobacterium subtsugae]
MSKPIIRLGDKTDHGGTVLEAFSSPIVFGKPAAGVGHKVSCPKCKGTFVIVEGAANTTFMGKNVAIEGMTTSCGAKLIASQGQATIDVAGGSAGASATAIAAPALAAASTIAQLFDQHFVVHDKDGKPLANWPYTIELPGGKTINGKTDKDGKTAKVSSDTADTATLHVYEPAPVPINPFWDQ